jgi:hypothetical protein
MTEHKMKIAPRNKYTFATMKSGDQIRFKIDPDDPRSGKRELTAAYAYGRRNKMKFFGQVVKGRTHSYMVIGRV